MKRIVAPLLLAMVALSGCTSASAPKLPESDYFSMSRDISGLFKSMDDATLRKLGKGSCEILKQGGDSGWLLSVKTWTDQDVPAYDAGKFIAYATAEYCPDQSGHLPKT